jgi:putative aminopeptidase FrvX
MNNLIKQIFSLQAESLNDKQQQIIFNTLLSILDSRKIKYSYDYDDYGNLYITKGCKDFYPCYVSHVDKVHSIAKNFTIHQQDDIIFATGLRKTRWNRKGEFQQVGIGGDDKAGIYLCIEMLIRLPECKVVFFKDEETGCTGSRQADVEFFNDCSFIAQGDRRGANDFITYTNGVDVCTDEFIQTIRPTLNTYKYKEARGTMTDVGQLIINGVLCCAFNVSCGYYNAHTDQEYQSLSELNNCMLLFLELAEYSDTQHAAPEIYFDFDFGFKDKYDFWVKQEENFNLDNLRSYL